MFALQSGVTIDHFLPQSVLEYLELGQSAEPLQNDVMLTQRLVGEFTAQNSCDVALQVEESAT
jgi:hypothetical protein